MRLRLRLRLRDVNLEFLKLISILILYYFLLFLIRGVFCCGCDKSGNKKKDSCFVGYFYFPIYCFDGEDRLVADP